MTARARIRYLAITAKDPEVLARYYAIYFGMWLLGESADGDISLTDGFYNFTVLKQRPGLSAEDGALGTNHFGIEVDDLHEVERRLADASPGAKLEQEPGGLHHGEYRV